MMRTAISRVAVWRPAARTTDDTRADVALDPVKRQDRSVPVAPRLEATFTLPPRGEHRPGAIEAHVHRAGLEARRAVSRATVEHADRQLVLAARAGKAGRGV
jgi:hypothetical protein